MKETGPTHLVAEAMDRKTICGIPFDRGGRVNDDAYPHVLVTFKERFKRVYCRACVE